MKVAVFHWYFQSFGGGEWVATKLADALKAPLYSLFSSGEYGGVHVQDISPYLPKPARLLRRLNVRSLEMWLWQMLDVTDLGDFDAIITSGCTTTIIPPDNVLNVRYQHSLGRWLFDLFHIRWKQSGRNPMIFAATELFRIKESLYYSCVDHFFVNSELIKRRMKHYLGIGDDAVILYPPIHTSHYHHSPPEPFLLHIGRLDKAKNILPVIQACIQTKTKLILIGPPGDDDLTRYFNHPLIEYRGYVPIEEKLDLLSRCKAVIYNPINEDFGIVPCEALASGKPVIVNDTGYPPYIVKKTGVLRKDGAFTLCKGGIIYPLKMGVDGLAKAIKLLDRLGIDPDYLMEHAKMYDYSQFRQKLLRYMRLWLEEKA